MRNRSSHGSDLLTKNHKHMADHGHHLLWLTNSDLLVRMPGQNSQLPRAQYRKQPGQARSDQGLFMSTCTNSKAIHMSCSLVPGETQR